MPHEVTFLVMSCSEVTYLMLGFSLVAWCRGSLKMSKDVQALDLNDAESELRETWISALALKAQEMSIESWVSWHKIGCWL